MSVLLPRITDLEIIEIINHHRQEFFVQKQIQQNATLQHRQYSKKCCKHVSKTWNPQPPIADLVTEDAIHAKASQFKDAI